MISILTKIRLESRSPISQLVKLKNISIVSSIHHPNVINITSCIQKWEQLASSLILAQSNQISSWHNQLFLYLEMGHILKVSCALQVYFIFSSKLGQAIWTNQPEQALFFLKYLNQQKIPSGLPPKLVPKKHDQLASFSNRSAQHFGNLSDTCLKICSQVGRFHSG